MHPWRVGEPLAHTWEPLSPWLAGGKGSVPIKDSAFPRDPTPWLIDEGTLPW
jgi:hypothetical protein